jgi:hypothetical protein
LFIWHLFLTSCKTVYVYLVQKSVRWKSIIFKQQLSLFKLSKMEDAQGTLKENAKKSWHKKTRVRLDQWIEERNEKEKKVENPKRPFTLWYFVVFFALNNADGIRIVIRLSKLLLQRISTKKCFEQEVKSGKNWKIINHAPFIRYNCDCKSTLCWNDIRYLKRIKLSYIFSTIHLYTFYTFMLLIMAEPFQVLLLIWLNNQW